MLFKVYLSNSTADKVKCTQSIFKCRVPHQFPISGGKLRLVGYCFNNSVSSTQPRLLDVKISFLGARSTVVCAESMNSSNAGTHLKADTDRRFRDSLLLPNPSEHTVHFPNLELTILDAHVPSYFTVELRDAADLSAYKGILNAVLIFHLDSNGAFP